MKRMIVIAVTAISLAAFILPPAVGNAQSLDIPANFQAVFFKKVFPFFTNISNPKVSLIYNSKHGKSKDALMEEFQKSGINVEAVEQSDLGSMNGNIIYLCPNLDNGAIDRFRTPNTVVITSERRYLDSGHATFVLTLNKQSKPQLLGNANHIKASGTQVDGALLSNFVQLIN